MAHSGRLRLYAVFVLLALPNITGTLYGEAPDANDPSQMPAPGKWFRVDERFPKHIARGTSTDGILSLTFAPQQEEEKDEFRIEIDPGYYFLVITAREEADSLRWIILVRLERQDSPTTASFRVSRKIVPPLNESLEIEVVRLVDVPESQLKKFPTIPTPFYRETWHAIDGGPAINQSLQNQRKIGLKIHEFVDAHMRFPPRVVYGPDGKPWHSWRVLILESAWAEDLSDRETFELYRWDEPWDGPNNVKLLDRMPAIFHNPVFGEQRTRYTHYAAVAGPEVGFSMKRATMDGQQQGLDAVTAKSRAEWPSLRDFQDPHEQTLFVGTIDPDHQIPWTKPEDIEVTKDRPWNGKGGFVSPHRWQGAEVGMFSLGDGSVRLLPKTLSNEDFFALATHSGGETVEIDALLPRVTARGYERRSPYIFLDKSEDEEIARWIMLAH